jgi:hypothetical protein
VSFTDFVTDYIVRAAGEVHNYGVEIHFRLGWLGIILGTVVIAFLLNRAFPNARKFHLFFSTKRLEEKGN